MFDALPTKSLRLSDLLARRHHFTIPGYQRPYSWTLKEAGQLLEDVLAASGVDDEMLKEPDYFFGAILLYDSSGRDLSDSDPSEEERIMEIVDGQQRLLTLTILSAVLRDLGLGEDLAQLAQVDDLIAQHLVASDGRNRRNRIMLRGRGEEFFMRFVQEPGGCGVMPDEDKELTEDEELILNVREAFVTELSRLSAEERARLGVFLRERCHVVVILTHDLDRALRMFTVLNERGRPLQRNDILKAEVMRNLPVERMAWALDKWEGARVRLGTDFEGFFSHLRTVYGRVRPQVISGVRDVMTEAGGAERFIGNVVEPLSIAYAQVLQRPATGEAMDTRARMLTYLNRLSGGDWVPAAIAALDRFNAEPARADEVLVEIDRLAHLLRIMGLGAGKRVRRFGQVIEAIRSDRGLGRDHDVFRLSREDHRNLLYSLRDLHGRNPQVSKYVLMRLNDELGGQLTRLDLENYNVEHILPRRPAQKSQWRKWHPDSGLRETSTCSLGNLIVAPQKLNDLARNKEFQQKQQVYRDVPKFGPRLAIVDDVLSSVSWMPEDIAAREERMIAILGRMWRFENDKVAGE